VTSATSTGEDRRGRRLPFDGHVHTTFSPDSEATIDAYARQAVELGIPEVAITDHVDFDHRAPAYAYSSYEDRRRTVRDAAHRWAPLGLHIVFGVELTYERAREDAVRHHLRQNNYDFVIGSVHVGADSPYLAGRVESWIAGKSLPEIVAPYFEEVEAAARSELFDAIGHVDFVKRYLAPHVPASDLAAAPELIEPVLRALVETGTALEINTSGLRQAAQETYPSAATVARYRALGGERVTVGSDAHVAHHFAWALSDGYAAAEAAGLRPSLERHLVPA
jgi:histidinol-phosphatase (PHP family)